MLQHKDIKIEIICQCGAVFKAHDLGKFTRTMCDECIKKADLAEEARVQAEALLASEKAQRERVMRARIPLDWKNKMFSNSNHKIHPGAFEACENYANQFNPSSQSLIIYSDVLGSGKTHLAACIANYLLREKHMNLRFIKARDILLEIRGTFDRGSREGEDDVLNRLLNFPLLVIDDLGVDAPTEWTMSTFWSVFDRRLEAHLPVVVTTNYAPEDDGPLGERIGMGALSRLRGMCGNNIIAFKGKDLRRTKA
jgi:DNA replication protein DnaC